MAIVIYKTTIDISIIQKCYFSGDNIFKQVLSYSHGFNHFGCHGKHECAYEEN
jgi:hypothetical protein